MTGIPNRPSLQFSGYRPAQPGHAELYLPGYWDGTNPFRYTVKAKVISPDNKQQTVSFSRKGHYWVSDKTIPVGSLYQNQVHEQYQDKTHVVLDQLHTKNVNGDTFNVVSVQEDTSPKKSVVIADIFLDSVVGREKLLQLLKQYDQGDLYNTVRNHFNQFGGNEEGLKAVLPLLRKAGFTGLLLKPFIGGDNLSSHRYWTVDPYVLNSSFTNKEAFKGFLQDSLRGGFKLFSDGAFVNLGLSSPQLQSNIHHRFRSPYWSWFVYDQNAPERGTTAYPREAYEKHTIGRLPLKQDPQSGRLEPNYDRIDYRILNDPEAPGFDRRKPTFIQYYNPQVFTPDGQVVDDPPQITGNDDSIPNYPFRIDPKELQEKRQQAQKLNTPLEKKLLFLEWSGFRMAPPSQDGMPVKWVGQVDVALANMKNPDVQEYIVGAMAYWTRFVNNSYIQTVGRALSEVRQQQPTLSPTDWIDAITQRDETDATSRILPPIQYPSLDTITPEAAQAAMADGEKVLTADVEKALVETLRQEFPVSALTLPEHFKAVTSHPELPESLKQEPLTMPFRIISWILSPITTPLMQLDSIRNLFQQLADLLRPSSFDDILEQKLGQLLPKLDAETQAKLKHPVLHSQVMEGLGQTLYLQLLTGQTSEDPKAIEQGFYQTVPQAILHSDPETAKNLLVRFLKKRLKELDPAMLAPQLSEPLKGLDPQMASLAKLVLNQREYGLNWRIDAAKDVANIDRVRNAETSQRRLKLFEEEIEFVKTFWEKVVSQVRGIFSKSAFIAELTDFVILSNAEVARNSMEKLLNVFTSTPNMDYMFSSPMRLVHYAPRPDEFGDTQMKPSQYLKAQSAMSQAVPRTALMQYQNLNASHDFATASHSLLINPAIATMDLLNWWGLKDDLDEITTELLTKPDFADERLKLENFGIKNLAETLKALKKRAQEISLSDPVREYFDEHHKKPKADGDSWLGPTPLQIKTRFIKELFERVQPEELGLQTKFVSASLESVLSERIAEPSQARAMRAVISNEMQRLNWDAVTRRLNLPPSAAKEIRQRLNTYFYPAITQVIKQYGTHWGHQPLEKALDRVFDQMPAFWENGLPGNTRPGRVRTAIREQLYEQAVTPVLDKLKRIIALQVANPGNPSIYLPDWFGQSGSELVKNMYVQCRNLVEYHAVEDQSGLPDGQLTDKPYLRDFHETASQLLKLRSQDSQLREVLNNGELLIPNVNDDDGIVPVIRDNGQDQVIFLINTGKPNDIGWDKVGTGPLYKEIRLDPDQDRFFGFQLDMSNLHIPPNTRYVDPENGEAFVVNEVGKLVKADAPEEGVDMSRFYRLLVRQ